MPAFEIINNFEIYIVLFRFLVVYIIHYVKNLIVVYAMFRFEARFHLSPQQLCCLLKNEHQIDECCKCKKDTRCYVIPELKDKVLDWNITTHKQAVIQYTTSAMPCYLYISTSNHCWHVYCNKCWWGQDMFNNGTVSKCKCIRCANTMAYDQFYMLDANVLGVMISNETKYEQKAIQQLNYMLYGKTLKRPSHLPSINDLSDIAHENNTFEPFNDLLEEQQQCIKLVKQFYINAISSMKLPATTTTASAIMPIVNFDTFFLMETLLLPKSHQSNQNHKHMITNAAPKSKLETQFEQITERCHKWCRSYYSLSDLYHQQQQREPQARMELHANIQYTETSANLAYPHSQQCWDLRLKLDRGENIIHQATDNWIESSYTTPLCACLIVCQSMNVQMDQVNLELRRARAGGYNANIIAQRALSELYASANMVMTSPT